MFVEDCKVDVGIVVKNDVFFIVVCFRNGFVDFGVLFVKFIREDFFVICWLWRFCNVLVNLCEYGLWLWFVWIVVWMFEL